jgi:hypothetical protein
MDNLRKMAAEVLGSAALEERFGPKQASALDAILLEKQASTDMELMKVAAALDPNNVLSTYKKLGGALQQSGMLLDAAAGLLTHVEIAHKYGTTPRTVNRVVNGN